MTTTNPLPLSPQKPLQKRPSKRPRRIVLRSRQVFRGIQKQTRRATEDAIKHLSGDEKLKSRKILRGLFRKVLESLACNSRVLRNDEITTYEVDRELERRVECLEEEGRRLQREVENKRENALGLIEKRLQKIAAETSEKMKENAVQNVSVEDKGVGYSVEDVLGKELAERMRNRKEKALEMLKRLVVQGSDLKKRVGHVDKVLKMIKDCEPKSSLGELVNADDGVNKDEDNLTIDLTDITGTVIQSNRGRRSRMSLLTTPL